ncbi:MAG: NADH:ubiquinone reductase (Na(+)-transporting) subunit B [Cytophagales bacterium]|nr:NADH:ubiquinone reductase (Na(+)-transporting) subunit B [Cytophagales bacterium]MDW8385025.1 NADH:ubiquinone reductase (Na(+)-transporting) subunit B [Flammeovirgaceae bacterium]
MKFLHDILEKQRPLFERGGKFEKLYYLFEAIETFLFTPAEVTKPKGVQVRDAIDLKRLMMTVVIAMIPCLIFGIWNVGEQHYIATGKVGSFWDKFLFGAIKVIPIILVAYASGGTVEVIFAIIRKHPINEGFLVTGLLIPLIMPATIPLWQVALATVFAVLVAKEVFGGTGMNILNVAMTARAFLYFAYPSDISGEVWVVSDGEKFVDGYSGATALAIAASVSAANPSTNSTTLITDALTAANNGMFSFYNLFMGFVPGSIGETSTLMALIGAAIMISCGVASWKIIFSVFLGAYLTGIIFNLIPGEPRPYFCLPAHYHLVMGGLAFGAVFMATDPVSSAQTEIGKWIYGFLIGFLTVLIRVKNPAYPEGIMLAVLLMNVLAPLIDFYVVQANKRKRLKRALAV